MSTKTGHMTAKARLIQGLAALHGKSLAEVCRKSGVHRSVFYRVVRGERQSARVDRVIARELGITVDSLRSIARRSA